MFKNTSKCGKKKTIKNKKKLKNGFVQKKVRKG